MPQLRFFSDSTRKDKEVHFDDPQSEAAGEAAESALRPCGLAALSRSHGSCRRASVRGSCSIRWRGVRAESSGELPTGGIRALFFRWEALTRRRFGEEELQGSAAGRAVSGTRRSLAQVPAASTEGSAIWLPGHPEPGTASEAI